MDGGFRTPKPLDRRRPIVNPAIVLDAFHDAGRRFGHCCGWTRQGPHVLGSAAAPAALWIDAMVTTSNRLLDELARLATDAVGAAQGVRREVETVARSQVERLIRDMDVATREEVEVLRDMVAAARAESEALKAQVQALAARLDALEGMSPAASQPGT
jgi:BMFP domain-containing protein YqiC